MTNPLSLYKQNALSNLPQGMTYDALTGDFVVNGRNFPNYYFANWYLKYITKFGYIAGPSVSISGDFGNTIYTGSTIDAVVTGLQGGEVVSYQFLSNGSPITGATSSSYTATIGIDGLADGDSITVQIIVDGGDPIVSNSLTLSVLTVPAQMPNNWTVTATGLANQVLFNIPTAPHNGGYGESQGSWQYSTNDGASWNAIDGSGGRFLGELTETNDVFLPNDTALNVIVAAANPSGRGLPSSPKTVTPFVAPVLPDAFADNEWSFANTSGIGEMLITWSARPSDNGRSPLGLQYRVNGGNPISVASNATSGSVTLTGIAAGATPSVELAAVNEDGVGPWSNSKAATQSGIPNPFINSQWSVVATGNSGEAEITLLSLPFDNASSLTDLQYRVSGNAWAELNATAVVGTFTITGLTDNELTTVEIRARNANGPALPSDVKQVETFAPAAGGVPFGFAPTFWSLQDTGQSQELSVTILELPNDNGASITDIEYDIDRSGTFLSLGESTLGTFVLPSVFTNEQEVEIRIRAVNANGPSAFSSFKVATPTNSLVVPAQIGVNDWSLVNLETGGDARLTIINAPAQNGAAISDYEYSLDNGTTWVSLGISAPGAVDLAVFTDDVLTPVVVRAVNSFGGGIASDVKEVTTTNAAATVPFGFTTDMWSIQDAQTGGDAVLNITTLPANGGSPITGIQYQLQISGVNQAIVDFPISGPGSYDLIDVFTDGQATRIRIRPVNAIGPATDANWGVRKDITTTDSAPAPSGTITASGTTFDGADLISSDVEGTGTTGPFFADIVSHLTDTTITSAQIDAETGPWVETITVGPAASLDALDTTGLDFTTDITNGNVSVRYRDSDGAVFVQRATPINGLTVTTAPPSSNLLTAPYANFDPTVWDTRNGSIANNDGTATLDLAGGTGIGNWDMRMQPENGVEPVFDPAGGVEYRLTCNVTTTAGATGEFRAMLTAEEPDGSGSTNVGIMNTITIVGGTTQAYSETIVTNGNAGVTQTALVVNLNSSGTGTATISDLVLELV